MSLTATSRTLDIRGRAATVWGLTDGTGRSGLVLDPGQAFAVDLKNSLAEPTIIHWHGQIPDNAQDGVPDLPMPMLQPGEIRAYDFAARSGTHWMHAHVPAHEMLLLAAPLIVRRDEDVQADRQEVTLFLHDFSFKSPAEVLTEITGGASMAGMDHGQPGQGAMDHSGMDMGAMGQGGMMAMPGMDGMAMDLNDYNFDAYLANDRTLDDPEVVQVDKGGQVLVRVINAAAATVFWIDTGALPGRLVAVDGEPVQPLPGNRFGVAMGQRLDIELDVPREGGRIRFSPCARAPRKGRVSSWPRRGPLWRRSLTCRSETIPPSAAISHKKACFARSLRCPNVRPHRSRCSCWVAR
jgi:FtsP/CotA-like multicopper oxidase with cupredoxin domain